MAAKRSFDDQTEEILSRLDIFSEYALLGVRFAGEPRNGKCECYAIDRDEKNPSAVIFEHSGRYSDSASGQNYSLWDFAARFGKGHADWREARKFYADKVGIKLSAARPPENPAELLEFLPWDDGNDRLARLWCAKHKKGASLEAIKLAGGKVAHLLYRDSKVRAKDGQPTLKRTQHKCICLPCYGEKLLAADPVAWVIFDIGGAKFQIHHGKDHPPSFVKMRAVGATRGAMMGLHGLTRLAAAGPDEISLVWKVGGPTDMLALIAATLRDSPELLDTHLVVTNASSETGDVLPHQAAIFAGHKVLLCHDADEAGEVGAAKWIVALRQTAREVRKVCLPWEVAKKSGKDLRDFLNGEPAGVLAGVSE